MISPLSYLAAIWRGRGSRANQEGRSFENPQVPLSKAAGLEIFSDPVVTAGVRVSEETALNYSAVWRAVALLSGDVAKLPIKVLRREGEGWVPAVEHPAYPLLVRGPSRWMTSFVYRELQQSRVLRWGNGFSFVRRDRTGAPRELVSIHPREVSPEWNDRLEDLVYRVHGPNAAIVEPENMIHLRGLGDEVMGWSVIRYARESIGLSLAAVRHAGSFFGNGARPSTVLRHPAKLSAEAAERIRSDWERLYRGAQNAHKTAVLEEGMEVSTLSMSNADAEFLATRKFELIEIANWFGIPPHKLGDSSRTAYNSLEQEQHAYLDESLEPWLCKWESELEAKLLSDAERETHRIRFNRNALLRANTKDRSAFYEKAILTGWMSRDEVRAKEDLNPIPDGAGKVFLTPTMATPNSPEAESEAGDEGAGGSEAARSAVARALEDAALRMARRIQKQASRSARNPDRWLDWVEELTDRNLRVVEDALEPAVTLARALSFTEWTTSFASRALLASFSQTLGDLADLKPDELPAAADSIGTTLEENVLAFIGAAFTG